MSAQSGGVINVTSNRTAGAGITVQNGSQLVAMISAVSAQQTPAPQGGTVNLTTSGADITVDDSTIRASGANSLISANTGATGGTINVTGSSTLSTADSQGTLSAGSTVFLNTGAGAATLASSINLTGATLNADVLKIQALGTAGQITIGGGTLNGNTQLLLYAGDTSAHSSGLIDFTANTTLGGNVAGILAANTVRIEGGVAVDVTSPAITVYTNNPEYNTGNYGDFTGNGVAATNTFGSAGTPIPTAVKGGGRVVGTWTVGGHRITAVSTPVPKTPARVGTTPAGKVASLTSATRPGNRRAAKAGADRQPGRPGNAPFLQTLRPAVTVQR